jgi:hypothetical protein
MLSQGMSLTINGVDYVAAKTTLSGTIGFKNNLLLNQGYFPGSGTQNGAAIRGRLEIGARKSSFEFTVRLLSTSTEYAKLIAQTEGSAVLGFIYDSTHQVTVTFPKVAFTMVENTEADGIVAVKVTCEPMMSGTGDTVMPISASCQCGITGIAG